jgi:MoaA/NifB/PqqE/SkfB family radical SAM enzyme
MFTRNCKLKLFNKKLIYNILEIDGTKEYCIKSNFPKIISGKRKKIILSRIWIGVGYYFLKRYKNPLLIGEIRKNILHLKKSYTIENSIGKLALVDGRYYMNSNMNGWPSKLFYRPMDIEVKKGLNQVVSNLENLKMVQIALTKKCPLNCEHCYEGHELNKKDTLTLNDHKLIVKKLQSAGISVIQYGGGEPMTHVDDLVEILETAENISDFYLYSSGFNCTSKNLERLKRAGLTGVSIGLDHYISEKHNAFRRNEKAFQWAIDASKHAKENKLVLTFTICATKEFCTEENLWNYLNFAKEHGAEFMQVLEPRAAGNYEDKDVSLSNEQLLVIEKFFLAANSKKEFQNLPIVLYTGYMQRKRGCFGGGADYLYIDTDGYMSSCPFCRNSKTHILADEHEASLISMKEEGCGLILN